MFLCGIGWSFLLGAAHLHLQAPHGDPGLSAQIAGEQCQVPLLADHVLHCGGLQRFHHLDLIGKTVPLHIGERDGIPGVQSPYGCLLYTSKNVLLVNDRPVIGGSMKLDNYDIVTIGSTKLMFVGLCGKDFNWGSEGKEHE